MGLFSGKKKEQRQESLPPLKFPELPSMGPSAYEQTAMKEAAAIKQAVMPREMPRQEEPEEQQPMTMRETKAEQPLFIKVDAYKEVVDTLAVIKAKLADASHVLDELTRLKEEEDNELTAWHSDLTAIKEKLMLVDERLFEQ